VGVGWGGIQAPLDLVFFLVAVSVSGRAEYGSTSLSLSQTPCCSLTFILPLIDFLPGLFFVGVGVVTVALAMPRPFQGLMPELRAPGRSCCCPGISLPSPTSPVTY